MGKKLDLTGQKFNRLTAIKPTGLCAKKRQVLWEFLCECGNTIEAKGSAVKDGSKKSCGCLVKEIKIKHGRSKTYLYNILNSIKTRCNNPKSEAYPYYGGRGIKVCDRWLESFENFLEDMGERPSKEYSVERIDVNGDYCPNNCIWVTREVQARNHRKQCNNKTGVAGVSREGDLRYRATWVELSGKEKTKSFSINKYGEEKAFCLACEERIKAIKALNEKGAGYSDNHGR
jgi:hypothetical protein